MWVARGPPRIVKREADAVVTLCSMGHWKAEATVNFIELRYLLYKDEPYPPQRLERNGSTPVAMAFLPSVQVNRLVVLTSMTLEMYRYSLDISEGLDFQLLEVIKFGRQDDIEGRCLAVNEENIFVGTSAAQVMLFRWAYVGNGGHVISPLESLHSIASTFPTLGVECLSIACNSSFLLTNRIVVAISLSNGLSILMSFTPETNTIEDLIPISQIEKSTVCALDADASVLAVGTMNSSVHVFRLTHTKKIELKSAAKTFQSIQVEETPLLLSLHTWGYQPDDIGPISCLEFTHDSRAIAIGYSQRGLSVFSIDGCKLMSTLPQHLGGSSSKNEVARHGVRALQWSHASSKLVITPSVAWRMTAQNTPKILSQEVTVELVKDEDGLCLSLAGEPNQNGAWVHSAQPFVKRSSDGTPGPAELSKKLNGGELLLAINGKAVWQSPFEDIVNEIKELPVGVSVSLTFLVISFQLVFPLAVDSLTNPAFREQHQLNWEDHAIWEYSLRMQAIHGDCNMDVPSLMDFEARARFDSWSTLVNCSHQEATHRYAKLYLGLFPEWHPQHALQMLLPPPTPPQSSSSISLSNVLVMLDFARSVLPLGQSDLHLLESQSVVTISPRSLNDPCGVLSSISLSVPTNYAQVNQPMRLAAVNTSDTRLAVAGTYGFTLYNKRTSKWHVFGSEVEEQSFQVVAMSWWKDEVLVALVRQDDQLYLDSFPRNRLDLEARHSHITLSENCYALVVDERAIYCLSDSKVFVYRVTSSGALDNSNLHFSLHLFRTEPLPLCNAVVGHARCFKVVPRLQRRSSANSNGGSWFGGMWSLFSDTIPEWIMPRFLILDQLNCAYLWDPETKIQTLLASDVTHISSWSTPDDWPLLCSYMVGLYGRQGFQVWWPLMDNVVFGPPVDRNSIIQFLLAHDPYRAKSASSSLPKSLAWEDYSNLLAEYGVKLQNGVSFAESAIFVDPILKFNPEVQILGIHPWFGVLVGGLQDSYLGIFDLACRAQPFIHSTICYVLLQHQTDFARTILLSMQRQSALTTLTQELVLVAILDKCFQSKWNVEVLEKALILLKDPENEMETYCEIVANVARKVEPNRLPLLFPLAGDPSQLLQLCRQRNEIRTAANFLLCLDESITNEQASLRPRTNSFAQFQSRSGLAFELLVDCCEKEHLHLALQVVRVARAWEPEHYRSSNQQYDRYIDEQVGKYAFQMLVQHRFDKVVWLLTQVEATLPQLYGEELGIHEKNSTLIQTRLLALLTESQLRILHTAVVAARYDQWASLIKSLLDQPKRLQ
ncbi:hypothetical protein LEN26_019204 [Aphanomyces euteiches]|nr:hypothetical protein LEN26_019204 [Aphanomyces euteiches]KAH9114197.1 hypothetical protein AeMF1_011690 [Aphanomyces euteiches]KAH9196927.1 hypothetical protein AeNC1_001083 [Aphanomyces euteiches]